MTEESPTPEKEDSMLDRMRERLVPEGMPVDDRGRMRMVVDSLILHLHPTKVVASTMNWTYSWGLGGLSALLMAVLGMTGVVLQNNYTPSAPQAYLDILEINSNVWFGELIRNLHHWSANLLIVVAVLHLIRVFATGAYRPPRELNWLIGVAMLLLVVAANFTGYLLPWDQLAFWAITVGTSIINYVPLIGNWMGQLILGGPEVGANTLLNFYSMHISLIPLMIFEHRIQRRGKRPQSTGVWHTQTGRHIQRHHARTSEDPDSALAGGHQLERQHDYSHRGTHRCSRSNHRRNDQRSIAGDCRNANHQRGLEQILRTIRHHPANPCSWSNKSPRFGQWQD